MSDFKRRLDAAGAFVREDEGADAAFYASPRFVAHIDDGAIAAVTAAYRAVLPADGVLLDLMGSWISHLPDDVSYGTVIGHGMNAAELAGNGRLSRWFVQDLNRSPLLPLETESLDGVMCCVSVQYLVDPVAVFGEVGRCLRAGAPFVASFSNRCFPTKATAVWLALGMEDRARLLEGLLIQAGFASVETRRSAPRGGDPLFSVVARA
jgi:hypothetical protein